MKTAKPQAIEFDTGPSSAIQTPRLIVLKMLFISDNHLKYPKNMSFFGH